MGLDMYLFCHIACEPCDALHSAIVGALHASSLKVIQPSSAVVVESLATCWRKANQIHGWFVENVQGGVDDQGTYEVSREQLQELLDTCRKVQADHSLAQELLPTREGFFFGVTDYDEGYFEDIGYSVTQLEEVLKLDPRWWFTYSCWW